MNKNEKFQLGLLRSSVSDPNLYWIYVLIRLLDPDPYSENGSGSMYLKKQYKMSKTSNNHNSIGVKYLKWFFGKKTKILFLQSTIFQQFNSCNKTNYLTFIAWENEKGWIRILIKRIQITAQKDPFM